MKGKSPMMKALIGNQDKLPVELQKEILDSPMDMYGKKGSMAKKYKSDAQRKAVHASKAEKASAVKNYKKGYYGA
tara:strand:+ start:80 stop:304 length:225 start_codon:yes stop_codon:yes gene_type:complete